MSVANPVIDHVDPAIKRIFLASGVREYHPVEDIYKEIRWLRRTDDTHRWYRMPVSAGGNVFKGGGKYTPRYAIMNNGWRIVPDDVTHALYISGEQITDDGQSGPACMDTSLLSPGTNVTIHYEPPAAEVITVGGSSLDPTEIAIAMGSRILEGAVTSDQALRIILAALSGRTSGIGTDTEQYKSVDGGKSRITVAFDDQGNRVSVGLDGA